MKEPVRISSSCSDRSSLPCISTFLRFGSWHPLRFGSEMHHWVGSGLPMQLGSGICLRVGSGMLSNRIGSGMSSAGSRFGSPPLVRIRRSFSGWVRPDPTPCGRLDCASSTSDPRASTASDLVSLPASDPVSSSTSEPVPSPASEPVSSPASDPKALLDSVFDLQRFLLHGMVATSFLLISTIAK